MAHQFDACPRCEGRTEYGPVPDGGEGIYCPRCGWQPVGVEWVAARVNPDGSPSSPNEQALLT